MGFQSHTNTDWNLKAICFLDDVKDIKEDKLCWQKERWKQRSLIPKP